MSYNVAYPELGLIMIRLLLLSRPSRARGLKQAITGLALDAVFASITGAWIETRNTSNELEHLLRVHHGRVD